MEEKHWTVVSTSHLLLWAPAHKTSTHPLPVAQTLLQMNFLTACTPIFQKRLASFEMQFGLRVGCPQDDDFDTGFQDAYQIFFLSYLRKCLFVFSNLNALLIFVYKLSLWSSISYFISSLLSICLLFKSIQICY